MVSRLEKIGVYILMLFMIAFTLTPLAVSFLASLKGDLEVYINPYGLPENWKWENYYTVLMRGPTLRFFLNSAIIASLATLFSLSIGSVAGFGFSRFDFAGGGRLLNAFLALMMIPGAAFIIPLYVMFSGLGLVNTYLALILVYGCFNVPLAIWAMKPFFDSIPRELDDMGMIDGVSRFGAFLRLILPISLSGLAATTLLIFVYSWNEFIIALVLTTTSEVRTLPAGIALILGAEYYSKAWNLVSVASVASVIPTTVLFLVFQRMFIKGLIAGAIKG